MTKAEAYRPGYRGVIFWGAVFLVIIYGNSLAGQFVFDDWSNIVARPELRLEHLTPRAIFRTFFAEGETGPRLVRPLSSLSFALNYYAGGHQPAGYHLVNIIIHLLTAYFLFKTLGLLISQAAGDRWSDREKIFIAGLAALLWAVHPIQTQAVTYVVQRMASLAACFYMAGVYAYLRFRIAEPERLPDRKFRWLAGSLVLFFCAVLSKPNAIIFPLGLALVELFFFDGFARLRQRPVVILGLTGMIMIALFSAGLILLGGRTPAEMLSRYDYLPFTLTQRLLTEPRVLFLYLSQLLYPVPGAFSLVHDVAPSVSLLDPPATLAALAGLLVLIGLGVVIGRKYPLVGFPIIFYFVHHLVESTILPLALVYEHRNYLPSLFFFLPLALALAYGLRVYQQRSRAVWGVLFLFTASLVFLLGLSTHIRNQDWRSSGTIWQSALGAAPGVVKPYLGLGRWYLQQGQLGAARAILAKGVQQRVSGFIFEKADAWSHLATIYYQRGKWSPARQAAENSLRIYLEAVHDHPHVMGNKDVRNSLAGSYYFLSCLEQAGSLEKALDRIDQALAIRPIYDSAGSRVFLHNIKANYLLRLGRPEAAAAVLRQGRRLCPENDRALMMLGYALTAAGEYERGRWLYQDYLRRTGRTEAAAAAAAVLYLAENQYLAGNPATGDARVRQYLVGADTVQADRIMRRFQQPSPRELPFLDPAAMRRRIQANLCRLAEAVIHS